MSLLDRSLAEQAAAISAGEADPGELLDECLTRIEQRDPLVNAVVDTFPERSREMLKAAPRGPLHGVPVVIKDEWPLPWRAERLAAAQTPSATGPGESGPFRALRDAGAVIAGIANMHELGSSTTGNASVYGAARNPWDTQRCPGGSSSGSAAAVAARIVSGSVGADGVGSIRCPAAYCGLTGLKPTFGRAAMAGHHLRGTTMVVSGPLTSDAASCRLLASALFGDELQASEHRGLRIGILDAPVASDCTDEVRRSCEEAIEGLRAECDGQVRGIEVKRLEWSGIAAVLMLSTEGLGEIAPSYANRLDPELGPINRGLIKYRLLLPAAALVRATLLRAGLRRELVRVFGEVDVIAWPTVPAPAPPLDAPVVELPSGTHSVDSVSPRSVGLANLTGIPAISVPVGLSSEGLPIGLQLQAAWGRDALLLDAAEALERHTQRRWVEALCPIAGGEPAAA